MRNGTRNSQTAPKAIIDTASRPSDGTLLMPIIRASSSTVKPSMRPRTLRSGKKQPQRILEIAVELGALAAAFGDQPQLDAQQRAEGGLNGAHVDRGARQQEQG